MYPCCLTNTMTFSHMGLKVLHQIFLTSALDEASFMSWPLYPREKNPVATG